MMLVGLTTILVCSNVLRFLVSQIFHNITGVRILKGTIIWRLIWMCLLEWQIVFS